MAAVGKAKEWLGEGVEIVGRSANSIRDGISSTAKECRDAIVGSTYVREELHKLGSTAKDATMGAFKKGASALGELLTAQPIESARTSYAALKDEIRDIRTWALSPVTGTIAGIADTGRLGVKAGKGAARLGGKILKSPITGTLMAFNLIAQGADGLLKYEGKGGTATEEEMGPESPTGAPIGAPTEPQSKNTPAPEAPAAHGTSAPAPAPTAPKAGSGMPMPPPAGSAPAEMPISA
ncbi:hypothetical protein KJ742_00845 [Patescibacteria group bacterium]|nr:hypothetical protein [Patescibacteria group bacterium]MBU1935364.1 hypothetical protein [Patescibacteria group bacterium]